MAFGRRARDRFAGPRFARPRFARARFTRPRTARRAGIPALAALLLLTILPLGGGIADAASGSWAANCDVNVRAKPTTASSLRVRIPKNTSVTASRIVSGAAYGTTCGKRVWGRTWLAVTAIAGRSVRSTYGVATMYAAAELFRATGTTASGASGVSISRGIRGVDVSQWNGQINFARVRAGGQRFVIARATAGRLTTDKAYARNRAGALAAGLKFTAYHFAVPDRTGHDAIKEADHFLAVAQLRRGMLVPVLDLEVGGGLGRARLTAWVKAWLGRVSSKLHVKPMIYTTQSFWRSHLGDTRWFVDRGYRLLWIAHWDTTAPRVPARNWGGHSWALWQYSECGRVAGISSRCVDLDVYHGKTLSWITWTRR